MVARSGPSSATATGASRAHPSTPASTLGVGSSSSASRRGRSTGPPGTGTGSGGAVGVADGLARAGRSRARRARRASSRATRTGADGSWNVTVPTLTALAPGQDELERVEPGADAAHAEDRHLGHRRVHLVDAAHRDRADRRAGQPAGDAGERRAHRVGVDHHAEQRVDHRQAVGAGVDDGRGRSRRCR